MTRKTMSGHNIDVFKPSLQMPKKVAEDVTGLLYNEKVSLITGTPDSQKAFDKVLEDNNFTDEIVTFLELVVGAYGDGVIVEYITNDKIKYNFIYGDKIMILDYTNSTVTGIAVIDEFQENKKQYTHIMEHTYIEGVYRIEHLLYETKDGNRGLGKQAPMTVLFSDEEIAKMMHAVTDEENEIIGYEYYLDYDSEPHFQMFKPAIVNNHDVQSPRGIAVTANALSSFDGIDNKSFNLDREDSLTRTRIFIDDKATQLSKIKNSDGTITNVKYFDENEDVYQVLKGMLSEGSSAVETSNPTYDSAPRIEAIKLDLAMIGFRCGLGTDYYSFENGSVYVNEANVISSNSDTWRNRQKHINRLKVVLIDMMKASMFLLKELGEYEGDLDNLKYDVMFDDTIITDDTAIRTQMKEDSISGHIAKWRYNMFAYKVSEKEAKEMVAEADEEDKAAFEFALEEPEEEETEEETE
jgi:A118 family predicted phage portal protein